MPGPALQTTALITVTGNPSPALLAGALTTGAAGGAASASPFRLPHRAASPAPQFYGIWGSAPGGGFNGPSLELDECQVSAAARDRDLLTVDGSGGAAAAAAAAVAGAGLLGAAVTARYCKLRGGANAVVATNRASLHLDCCVIEVRGLIRMCVRQHWTSLLSSCGTS